jgi:hypothetical protein
MTFVIVHRTVARDPMGEETVTKVRQSVPGALVAPRTATEDTGRGRRDVIVGLTAYLPPGFPLDSDDWVEVEGLTYEVEGEPGVWRDPSSGREVGTELALTRSTTGP